MIATTQDVFVGDALAVLRTLPDQHVHCCITSPPYYGLRDYGMAEQIGLEHHPSDYIRRLVDVFREVRRVLRDDGTLWVNMGDSYAAQRGGTHQSAETLAGGIGGRTPDGSRVNCGRYDGYNPSRNARAIGLKHKDLMGIPWRLAFALQDDGWYLRQDIIWAKPNPKPESVEDRCTKAHEYLFLLSKSERYHFDHKAIMEPATGTHPGNRNHGDATVAHAQMQQESLWPAPMRNRRSVWFVACRPFRGAHFATFPVELVVPPILAGCPAGGTVLDPFAGSGTVGVAAKALGRSAVLVELNPEYAAMARSRIEESEVEVLTPCNLTVEGARA
jgi:site-specific DNA-methyltransferase (adenine-specific)